MLGAWSVANLRACRPIAAAAAAGSAGVVRGVEPLPDQLPGPA
jgi:hypothetical protein